MPGQLIGELRRTGPHAVKHPRPMGPPQRRPDRTRGPMTSLWIQGPNCAGSGCAGQGPQRSAVWATSPRRSPTGEPTAATSTSRRRTEARSDLTSSRRSRRAHSALCGRTLARAKRSALDVADSKSDQRTATLRSRRGMSGARSVQRRIVQRLEVTGSHSTWPRLYTARLPSRIVSVSGPA